MAWSTSPLIVRPSADFRVPALARGWRAPAYLQDFYFEHKLRKPRLALRPGSPARSWQLDSGGARALGLLTRGPYALPMALIDYGSKERARAVAKTAARGALTFETLASALFIAGGGLGAIESTLMAKAIAWLSLDAYDFFDDPPRADFERSTRSRRRSFQTDAFGDTIPARIAAAFSDSLVTATADLRATVRAVERGAGARRAGASETAELRVDEARWHSLEASAHLVDAANRGDAVAEVLLFGDTGGRPGDPSSPSRGDATSSQNKQVFGR